MPAEVGKPAPDFTLRDTDNNPVSLSDLKGKKAVIVLIPFPWTGHLRRGACAIRDDQGFHNEGAETVIITTYPRPALKQWSEQNNLGVKVLSTFLAPRRYRPGLRLLQRAARRRHACQLRAGRKRRRQRNHSHGHAARERDHDLYKKALSAI